MYDIIAASLLGTFSAYFSLRKIIIERFPRLGIVGKDVHKPGSPVVPEMAGIALLIGITVFLMSMAIFRGLKPELLSIFSTVIISGIVGSIDDLKKLDKRIKPLLTMLSGFPIIIMNTTQEYLNLPLGISFHIPTLYKLVVPIALAVTSNAINMFDPMNGVASGTSLIVLSFLALAGMMKILYGGMIDPDALIQASLMLIPILVIIYHFNRYPARVFVGDTGTLSMGAAIGAFSIVFGLEVMGVIALMIPITNAFFSLSSFGGLFERSELKQRPIIVREDSTLEPNLENGAPITFTRMMLLLGYRSEKELIEAYMQMVSLTALIGLIVSTFLITW